MQQIGRCAAGQCAAREAEAEAGGIEAQDVARMVSYCDQTAVVYGSVGAIDHIVRFDPRPWNTTGMTLLRADAPRWRVTDETPMSLVCVDCLLDESPQLGRGLDLARRHGAATLAGGAWQPDLEAAQRHARIADEYALAQEHEVS